MTTTFGFVSTHPPTVCGLATFNAALFNALVNDGPDAGRVIRVVESMSTQPMSDVTMQLVNGDTSSMRRAISTLNQLDVAIVQHEYGIYGGSDGEEVLSLLAGLRVPKIVVLHTVLAVPTDHQRDVLNRVADSAEAVVVMTAAARDRLGNAYDVDMSKVNVIPHGTHVLDPARPRQARDSRPTILTWGLIGPGKGIEWGIAAIAEMQDMSPMPRYLVAGQTHPKVLKSEGEAYREGLVEQIERLGLTELVELDNRYRDTPALVELVDSADVVLLPYDSTQQVTSGVLTEALGANKPVVATEFPHAVEVLRDEGAAGILVPHRNPSAIAAALREILSDDHPATWTSHAANVPTSSVSWSSVAERYRSLANRVTRQWVAA